MSKKIRRRYKIGDRVELLFYDNRIKEGIIFGYTESKGVCILSPGARIVGETLEYRMVCKTDGQKHNWWSIKKDVPQSAIVKKLSSLSIEELLTHEVEQLRTLGHYLEGRRK